MTDYERVRAILAAPAVTETADLRAALVELLDDYLATHGPDGYPQPMPQAWRVVQAALAGTSDTEEET